MALVLPSITRRPTHPLGDTWLLASQRRVPADTTGTRLWLPSDLGSKLQLWLKPESITEANGVQINAWADSSGNAVTVTGAGSSSKPTAVVSGLNGFTTVAFDGTLQSKFTLPSTHLSARTGAVGSATFFVSKNVSDPNSSHFDCPVSKFGTDVTGEFYPYTTGDVYSNYCSTARNQVPDFATTLNAWRVGSFHSKTNDWRYYLDGSNMFTLSSNTFATNTAAGISSSDYDGQVAEIVDCADVLTTTERQLVEGYLAWKFGLEGNLPLGHVYAAAAPRVAVAASNELSGTSSLTLSPSATATGLGTLGGSSALTFADSGTLTGLGSVAGSSSLVLSPSGTTTGLAALLGTTTLTFTPSATATGLGRLIGSSTLVLAPSGTATGLGRLIGTAPLTFAPTGTVGGLGALAGTVPLSLAGSGTITGIGSLLASTALSFGLSGTLGTAGSNALVGSAALVFASAATLTGLGPVAASTSLSLTISGVLISRGPRFVVNPKPANTNVTNPAFPSETNVIGAVRPGKVPLTTVSAASGTFVPSVKPPNAQWRT